MMVVASTSDCPHCELVRIVFLQVHRQTDYRFCTASGVEHTQHNQHQFRFRRAAFYSQIKSKVGNILTKTTTLHINLNIDDAPIASRAHTHPSHSQTPRHLFTSLSLGASPPTPPSVREASPSSSFRSLSLTTPKPFHIFPTSSRVICYNKHTKNRTLCQLNL